LGLAGAAAYSQEKLQALLKSMTAASSLISEAIKPTSCVAKPWPNNRLTPGRSAGLFADFPGLMVLT